MSAPTPGPWLIHAKHRLIVQADGAFAELTVNNGKVEGDNLPKTICLLRNPDGDFSEDETLANGFLMAASHELFEALSDFVSDCTNEECERCIKGRAALSKARGEPA